MAYNNKQLYIVDMFFITALNTSNGDVIWKSWLGTELYTTPAYADGKIYVTTDRRFVYALNATNGNRLSFFETGSNSWSSPSVYEGRLYFGNNDNNVYCLGNYPITKGQILVELDKNIVENGDIVTGCGQLEPGISYVTVNIIFKNSDETINFTQVVSQKNGAFSFDISPNEIGNYTISIFCSGSAYILEGEEVSLRVIEKQQENDLPDQSQNGDNEPTNNTQLDVPTEYIVALIVIIIILITLIAYRITKKNNESSPVPISSD
ncbi:MAG: PQQ-binding-like beta-propeller repeat protein [Candidatus Bathyarchaeota archaeon]